MKKVCLSLIAMIGLVFASVTFAAVANGYYISKHPLAFNAAAKGKSAFRPATYITIINKSSNYFYVTVPGTSIFDKLYSLENEYLINNNYGGDTYVALKDPYYSVFFQNYLCHYALVNVYGGPGNYRIDVDSTLC
ncbi:MAG: hypothetical protein A3F42_07730 [Gammaproteobacteria bacterium RIFCSPHIGHO2_12_FULL_37_34]|nr:MAG: hypothetical protein A3F42_07730 [Gammaproteobacteria bacterium RIFCSPHIGHO2_12_FULL_37_34]